MYPGYHKESRSIFDEKDNKRMRQKEEMKNGNNHPSMALHPICRTASVHCGYAACESYLVGEEPAIGCSYVVTVICDSICSEVWSGGFCRDRIRMCTQ